MYIFLGNLTPEQLEKRLGITLTDSDRNYLSEHRQEKVNNTPLGDEKFHIYDIPLMIMCDTINTAIKVRDMMMVYHPDTFKETFQVGWER